MIGQCRRSYYFSEHNDMQNQRVLCIICNTNIRQGPVSSLRDSLRAYCSKYTTRDGKS